MSSRRICGRALDAGPGSCAAWWESCPDKVAHCFMRYVRERGGQIDLEVARGWEAERDKALEPQRKLL